MSNKTAKYLIIGGGIIGCSVAYHLAKNGQKDILLLEKSNLTEGATWHAAGLVGQLRSSRNTTRMLQKSVAMYDRLAGEIGVEFDWKKVGSLRLASTKERLLEAKRLKTMARSFNLEMEIITASEAKKLFPYIDDKGLEGAAFIPSDGHVDPASLCQAIATGARKFNAKFKQKTKVLDFEVSNKRITKVITNEGNYQIDVVIMAAGMWSRELCAKLGINLPVCAIEHQYIITEPLPDIELVKSLPTLRDPERLVYYKPDVGGRLVIGGYEDNTIPFGDNGIPGEFERQLLPDNLDRFSPLAEMATKVTPILEKVGIRQVINGPIPYSADGDFVMGWAPGFDNLMMATGFLYGIAAGGGAGEMIAEWIVDKKPSLDLWPLDSRRFSFHHGTKSFMYPRAVEQYAYHYKMRYPGQEYQTSRKLRLSPLYKILKNKGSVYGSKNGWERPLWFAPKGIEQLDQLAFLNPGWHKYVADEHRSVREKVALIDQTSFGKFELLGNGSLELLQYLTTCNMDKPIGSVIYSQLCNEKGGIEADLTITRLGLEHFYIVTGSTFGTHDTDWIRQHIPKEKSIYLMDVSSARAVINICGPKSREVLQQVSENDLSNISFPFGTSQEIIVGSAKVLAIRIGFVGELGWELHIPTEFTQHVYELLTKAGENYGIRDVGYRAIESLRLEKGYLYWSSDITPDYTPLEAGLNFRVHLKSKGNFIGKKFLKKQKINGINSKLCTFISEKKLSLFGGETILLNRKTVSLATSGGYGFTVNKTILFGYLDSNILDFVDFEVEVFGEQYPIKKVDGPMYDPQNKKLKT